MSRDEYPSNGLAENADSDEQRREVRLEIPDSESVSATVTEAVSKATGKDLQSLRPLHDVIDPEALDSLCSSMDDTAGRTTSGCRVTFRYEGQWVRAVADERIVVTPAHDE